VGISHRRVARQRQLAQRAAQASPRARPFVAGIRVRPGFPHNVNAIPGADVLVAILSPILDLTAVTA
jgi:hypothetical protein